MGGKATRGLATVRTPGAVGTCELQIAEQAVEVAALLTAPAHKPHVSRALFAGVGLKDRALSRGLAERTWNLRLVA